MTSSRTGHRPVCHDTSTWTTCRGCSPSNKGRKPKIDHVWMTASANGYYEAEGGRKARAEHAALARGAPQKIGETLRYMFDPTRQHGRLLRASVRRQPQALRPRASAASNPFKDASADPSRGGEFSAWLQPTGRAPRSRAKARRSATRCHPTLPLRHRRKVVLRPHRPDERRALGDVVRDRQSRERHERVVVGLGGGDGGCCSATPSRERKTMSEKGPAEAGGPAGGRPSGAERHAAGRHPRRSAVGPSESRGRRLETFQRRTPAFPTPAWRISAHPPAYRTRDVKPGKPLQIFFTPG